MFFLFEVKQRISFPLRGMVGMGVGLERFHLLTQSQSLGQSGCSGASLSEAAKPSTASFTFFQFLSRFMLPSQRSTFG
jgi:hypothetical protein